MNLLPVNRRHLLLGGALGMVPLALRAQQAEPARRIALLLSSPESNPEYHTYIGAFRRALQSLGWTEGRNIQIDARWGALDVHLQQRFASELIALRPNVIITENTPTTAAVLEQTRTIPTIFAAVTDPVGSGFVAGLPRPGGNATGFIDMEASLAGKWLELLKEIAPQVARVAFLFNPATAPFAEYYLAPFRAAAAALAVKALARPVGNTSELESAIAAQAREPDGGLVVMPEAFLNAHRAEVSALAVQYRLPSVYPYRFYAEWGGLLSYGNDLLDSFQRAASYADRILRGEKPAELPVQVPVKYELIINLKTASALGLKVPVHLQQLADEVIE